MISEQERHSRRDLVHRINNENQKKAKQFYAQDTAPLIIDAWDKIRDIINYTEEDIEPHRAEYMRQIAQMNRAANAVLDTIDRERGLV